MGKRWTEDEEVYLEYCLFNQEGVNYHEVADYLGRSYKSVIMKGYRMRKVNDNLSGQKRAYTTKQDDYLRMAYKKGFSREEMSLRLNRTQGSVSNRLALLGVIKLKKVKDYDEEIRDLAKRGFWKAEIGRILNFSPSTITRYTKEHNIQCKHAPENTMKKI